MKPQEKEQSAIDQTQELVQSCSEENKCDMFANLDAYAPNYEEIYGFCEDMD